MFSRNGKLAYRLELVEIDALLQAGQTLDPEREMQFDMPNKFVGPYR